MTHSWCGLEYTFGNPSFATDSNDVVLVDLLYKLVFRHSLGRMIYMPALVLESSDSLWADIFEEEEPKILVFHRVKHPGLTDMRACATAPPSERIVKNGGLGGDGDGDGGGGRGGHCNALRWVDGCSRKVLRK